MSNQQSSFVVYLRGLIMLSSLAVFPYLAMSGCSLPSSLEQLIPAKIAALFSSCVESPSAPASQVLETPLRFAPEASGELVVSPSLGPGSESDPFETGAAGDPAIEPLQPLPRHATTIYNIAEPSVERNNGNVADSLDQDLAALETKLQAYGAVTYHLEEWGVEGNLFRFVCEVAMHDQDSCRRHLEAIAETPQAAMHQVLAAVEARSATSN
ncbi:MAG: hypothetical protein KDA42_13005 [Planctomycetales bacterium]|nr:hypothetical protein [Planctomycetales bacterium]